MHNKPRVFPGRNLFVQEVKVDAPYFFGKIWATSGISPTFCFISLAPLMTIHPLLCNASPEVCPAVQGTALDMMEDVNTGIGWVLSRIGHDGADPKRVYVVAQACGAQLSMMCLVTQVHPRHFALILGGIWQVCILTRSLDAAC